MRKGGNKPFHPNPLYKHTCRLKLNTTFRIRPHNIQIKLRKNFHENMDFLSFTDLSLESKTISKTQEKNTK